MTEESLFRDRVRERDLDNFLVEELHASTTFRQWILDRLPGAFVVPGDLEARIQKSPPRLQDNRQTDVRIGWFFGTELRACILIESKVTADFQPGQAASYALELEKHRLELGRLHAAAILVAPLARSRTLAHDDAFDCVITLEEITAFLDQRIVNEDLSVELSARLGARIDLLNALSGKRSSSQWTPATVAAKRDFAEAYADLAATLLPDFPVRPSTDGPKAITRIFNVSSLPPEFQNAKLRHEFGNGTGWKYANLQFPGRRDRLQAIQASRLLEGTPFSVTGAGQSLAIRVRTPAIDPTQPFETQEVAVREGLAALSSLVEFICRHAPQLAAALR